jgi:ABC-type branched-subunit amino acid transport system ATPase component
MKQPKGSRRWCAGKSCRGLGVVWENGQSILLVDKNLDELMKNADRHYIVENGRVVWSGRQGAFFGEERLKWRYFEV